MSEYTVGVHEWHNHTTINPIGLISTAVLGAVLVLSPRRYSIVPMLILACFIPSAQRLVIAGADFDLLRILVVFGWFRIAVRGETRGFVWNSLDTMVGAWMLSGTLIYTISYGTPSAFINRCGWMFDGFGMYFFFRCVLREWRDIQVLIYTFILLSIPVAVAFCVERATGRNAFSVFGGVPEFTRVREGRLRCQGAYAHEILAGCFWVGVIPWIVSYLVGGAKWLGGIGIVAALVIIVNCASSTPIIGLGFLIVGVLLYKVRRHVKAIRWGFLFVLVFLHLIMEAPVWHLISRVDIVGGSTGHHRYSILNSTINNVSKWWLLGEKNPLRWGNEDMVDITNHYILEALNGGLLTLLCFVILIAIAFGLVGKSLRSLGDSNRYRFAIWSIGVALFAHVCMFFAVSYFGQIIMLWYLTLATIGSLERITSSSMEPSTHS